MSWTPKNTKEIKDTKIYKRMKMRDLTGYPLSPNQRKEVEEYMNNHNVTENEARYALGYVPGDLPQVSIEEAFVEIEDENPDSELSYDTIGFYCEEIMKRAIPKPNPNCIRMWLEHSTKLKDLLYEENDNGYRQLKGFRTIKELMETLQKLPQDCEIWTNLDEDDVVKAPVNILYQVEDNSFRFL